MREIVFDRRRGGGWRACDERALSLRTGGKRFCDNQVSLGGFLFYDENLDS